MKRSILLLAIVCSLVMAACNQAAPTPAPEELLAQAATAMEAVQSLQFTIERIGDPVPIEESLNASLLSAAGEYDATNGVHVRASVQIGETPGEIDMLWIANGMYISIPPLPYMPPPGGGIGFDPTIIFDPESGLPYILTEVLQNPTIIGTEQVEEFETYHVTAQASGEDLATLAGGAVSAGETTVDLWIEVSTSRVVRINLSETENTGYLIDFYAFDEPVEIPTP
jgi:hypothetical protein